MVTDTLERPDLRALRLREATHSAHEELDQSLMRRRPFHDRDRYGRFVEMQYRFFGAVEPFYRDAALGRLVPDLGARSRLEATARDLADLGLPVPEPVETPADLRGGIGWLYVAEGSTLGAAFLLKAVQKIGLDASFGARHMAPAPGGRGLHWRTFTEAINTAELSEEEDALAVEGAKAAFAHVRDLADTAFASAG